MYTIDSWPILLPTFVIFLVILLIWGRKKNFHAGNYLLMTTFAIYLLAVIHLVLFPIHIYLIEQVYRQPFWLRLILEINFIPILTIDIPTFVLNIIMCVPLGVYLPLISQRIDSVKKAAKIGLFFSLSIEISQLTIEMITGSGRTADVNDLIANTLGATVGFYILMKLKKLKLVNNLISKLKL